jgi:hypothetical protein
MPDWLRRSLYGPAVVVALFSLFLAFDRGRDEQPPVVRGPVARVFPEPGAVAARQGAIGVDLAFGYDAALEIDGRAIPDDQLDRVVGINQLSFTPGDGKEIERLDGGRHCAAVRYFTAGQQPEDAGPPYSWCFTAA